MHIDVTYGELAWTGSLILTIISFTCFSFWHSQGARDSGSSVMVFAKATKQHVDALLDDGEQQPVFARLPRLPPGKALSEHVRSLLNVPTSAQVIVWSPPVMFDDGIRALAPDPSTSFESACEKHGVFPGHHGVYALRRYYYASC